MIGLHLPRGTELICVKQEIKFPAWAGQKLVVGNRYKLRSYQDESRFAQQFPAHYASGVFSVLLEDIYQPYDFVPGFEWSYGRSFFRIAKDLPASILECLNVKAPATKRQRENA